MVQRYLSRPGLLQKTVCLRQLSVLLGAGVPLPRSLEVLSKHGSQAEIQEAWRDVLRSVMEGGGLARAMVKYPRVFGLLEVGMVRAAERSSCLIDALCHLADLLEQEYKIMQMLRCALHYPIFLALASLGSMMVFMTHIMPVFIQGLAPDRELPMLTKALVWMSSTLSNTWFLIISGSLALWGLWIWRSYINTPQGRYQWQCILLENRIVGGLVKKALLSRFCRTLAILLRSGMPLLLCLEIAGDALANYPLAEAVRSVEGDVRDGFTMGEAFSFTPFFPPMLHKMVAVGEESGSVTQTLEQLSASYEQQVKLVAEQLSQLLEPLMLLIVGMFMGITMLGMFLPLYDCLNI